MIENECSRVYLLERQLVPQGDTPPRCGDSGVGVDGVRGGGSCSCSSCSGRGMALAQASCVSVGGVAEAADAVDGEVCVARICSGPGSLSGDVCARGEARAHAHMFLVRSKRFRTRTAAEVFFLLSSPNKSQAQ